MGTPRRISDEADLRAILGEPNELVVAKVADHLNELTRQFIERAPFVCVATRLPAGGLDVSPRGDPPGFVRVLDARTLLIPERPGNRLADTLTNLLGDPAIGLLFPIPGVGDTFRVNGSAFVTDDTELLAASTLAGSVPRLGIVVAIEEAYTQCSKALIRSELWNPERHTERSALPSQGAILRSLIEPSFDADAYDRERAARYARGEGLYFSPRGRRRPLSGGRERSRGRPRCAGRRGRRDSTRVRVGTPSRRRPSCRRRCRPRRRGGSRDG